MAEFLYQGVSLEGRPVQGTFLAPGRLEAKKRFNEITSKRRLRPVALHKRVPYRYKVRKAGTGEVQTGDIWAYKGEEVHASLNRMGYEILQVRRQMFRLSLPVPRKDVVVFIRLCADLLREKMPFDEILLLLSNDMENERLRNTVQQIRRDLSLGKDGRQVYLKHANVLGKFAAHMLSIASNSGNMAEVLDNIARFLERTAEFKKNLLSALFMPSVVVVAAIAALVFYVANIFPKLAAMLTKYDIAVPKMTAATLAVSDFLTGNYLWLLASVLLPAVGLFIYFRTEAGRIVWHRILMSLPIVGKIIFKNNIEIFARVFYALYNGSGENINAVKTASEACNNSYLEKRFKEDVIPAMLREGRSFTEALQVTGVFPKNAIYLLRSGEESGTLVDAALRLANYHEKEINHRMTQVINFVYLFITIFVSILILGITLLSSEIGFVSPPRPL